MSRPRFLADNDFNEHIVDGTMRREPAMEFLKARHVGLSQRTDPEVLAFAADNGLIVVSHDVNTMPGFALQRLSAGSTMPGLLMVQQMQPISPVIESPFSSGPRARRRNGSARSHSCRFRELDSRNPGFL